MTASLKVPLQYEDRMHITTADRSPQNSVGFIRVEIVSGPSGTHSLILDMNFLQLFHH